MSQQLSAADIRYMTLARRLGARGQGQVWPNPAVGCVIVKDRRIIGRGWTQPGGRPHAETVALAQAGAAARGATAYVTLEPCSHHGQTPPCAKALIDAGVACVFSAVEDPDPRVSGRGHAMLRDAGIEVETGLCESGARADLRPYFQQNLTGRPWLTLKLATSFDGRIATATGESQWITGPEARRYVHGLRARHDAVMVGGGTARGDNPSLTVRDLGMAHQPVRIVASRRLDLPLMGQLALSAKETPLWLLHGKEADKELVRTWQGLGARLIPCRTSAGQIEPASLMQALGEAGLTHVFCEGGGAFAAALLGADMVDELVGITAGVALGAEGLPSIGALGVEQLSAAPRFSLAETRALGGDVLHRWIASGPDDRRG